MTAFPVRAANRAILPVLWRDPVLLLLGLIVANKVFAVMASYLNATMGMAMMASQGTHTAGFFITVGLLVLLMYLHYQLAIRSLELVHRVPAMVAHMLGAQDMDDGSHRAATDVHGAVVGIGRSAAGPITGAAMTPGKPKDPAKAPAGDKTPSVNRADAQNGEV